MILAELSLRWRFSWRLAGWVITSRSGQPQAQRSHLCSFTPTPGRIVYTMKSQGGADYGEPAEKACPRPRGQPQRAWLSTPGRAKAAGPCRLGGSHADRDRAEPDRAAQHLWRILLPHPINVARSASPGP